MCARGMIVPPAKASPIYGHLQHGLRKNEDITSTEKIVILDVYSQETLQSRTSINSCHNVQGMLIAAPSITQVFHAHAQREIKKELRVLLVDQTVCT